MVKLTKSKHSKANKSRKNFNSSKNWRKVNNKYSKQASMMGGSPQSSLVMDDTMKSPVLNDYVTSPRIRQDGYDDAYPNSMCQGGGFTSHHPNVPVNAETNKGVPKQKGGSAASDMVMANLTDNATTMTYPAEPMIKGNMNSLKLYETTGGARKQRRNRHRNSHKHRNSYKHRNSHKNRKNLNKKTKKNKRNSQKRENRKHVMRGGASDWIMSNYSQGNINAPEQPASLTSQFSASSPSSRDMLMNPPTMGLAGSGFPMSGLEGANVRMTGAPVSF